MEKVLSYFDSFMTILRTNGLVPDIGAVAIVVFLIAPVAAVVAAWVAYRSLKENRRMADLVEQQVELESKIKIASLHAQLSDNVRRIQQALPVEVNDPNWRPTPEQRRLLQLYWYAVADEWLETRLVGPQAAHLWDNHYAQGVLGALKIDAFAQELSEMLKRGTSFHGQRGQFVAALQKIGVPLTQDGQSLH